MAYVPPGTFMMGCSTGDDRCDYEEMPAKQVTLTNGFCMDETEVTQGAHQKLIGWNPSYFMSCGADCPVEQVSWEAANTYCKMAGKRLPTEAEWEYAARSGSKSRFYGGVDQSIMIGYYAPGLDAIAWYHGNSEVSYSDGVDCSVWSGKQYRSSTCGTHPVGLKKANAFGLYDMSGNVEEWVDDCYSYSWYGRMPSTNPENTRSGCNQRVRRGGSWNDISWYVRVSSRDKGMTRYWIGWYHIGFRCAQDLN